MKIQLKPLLLLLSACILSSFNIYALADDSEKERDAMRKENRAEFKKMSSENQAQMRKAMRDHLENMSPEERTMLRDELSKARDKKDAEKLSKRRKGMHDHVQSTLTPEELKNMHNRVRAYMESVPPDELSTLREESNDSTLEQRAARRKQMHDHANTKMTSDELEIMHIQVKEKMQKK